MPPVALIDRVEAAVAGIAHTQTPPVNATDQYVLQQTKTLSGWPREAFAIGPVPRQALTVGELIVKRGRRRGASIAMLLIRLSRVRKRKYIERKMAARPRPVSLGDSALGRPPMTVAAPVQDAGLASAFRLRYGIQLLDGWNLDRRRMADFYPLIARAVAGLSDNAIQDRDAFYERARTTLLSQLRDVTPPLSEADIVWQRLSLEEAIRKVESGSTRAASYSAELFDRLKPPPFPSSKKPASIASSLSATSGLRSSASVAELTAIWRSISGNRKSAG